MVGKDHLTITHLNINFYICIMTDKNRNSNAHETQHIDSNPFFLKKKDIFQATYKQKTSAVLSSLKKKKKVFNIVFIFQSFMGSV